MKILLFRAEEERISKQVEQLGVEGLKVITSNQSQALKSVSNQSQALKSVSNQPQASKSEANQPQALKSAANQSQAF